MQFSEKNCGGIELHLDKTERELVYEAFLCYTAHGDKNPKVKDEMPKLCEILQVLQLPEFAENDEIKDHDTSKMKETVTFKALNMTLCDLRLICETFEALNESFTNNSESFPQFAWTMPIDHLGDLTDRACDLFEDIRLGNK